ncbi:hypothetical protein Ahy_B05g074642 [Arachis hypogaea]|uniref:Uncharacterized protein n=1 Tax=Arachis hypogaea TaxID=3818 RepID=A0A444YZH2_ARAHY|nr:hypothetical protein Ahy_B05g074642 [Arachis hypogaea]
MEVLRVQLFVVSMVALAFAYLAPSIDAQPLAPAPAPTSDVMKNSFTTCSPQNNLQVAMLNSLSQNK